MLMWFAPVVANTGHEKAVHNEKDTTQGQHGSNDEVDVTATIMHHIMDAHDWHVMDLNGHPVSVPLPIILYTDNGFVFGLSSAFHHDDHGSHVANIGGQRFVKNHGHIYYAAEIADAGGRYLNITHDAATGDEQILNGLPLDLSLTKNAVSLIICAMIILLIGFSAARAYRKKSVPSGIASFVEPIVVFIRDEVARPNIGDKRYKAFMPYLLTLFFFIWINNMLGLVPFLPGGANTTGNIAVTMVLAVCTLVLIVFNGNKHFWQHIFWMPGVPVPVRIMLAPIELVGVFTKPFALMIRLFANMTAGHIVILSLVSLIFIFKTSFMAIASVPLTLFIYLIKVLVALLQAYIFTLLTALFIGQAVEDHGHGQEHHH
ncbi:MAG: F0F1 ATP synthase subunit A [Bacteroidetes bacterium]|nr:F0F1 ATP synthase subunit A [Bacteroidota bacterium]